jgi:hypothetical protein
MILKAKDGVYMAAEPVEPPSRLPFQDAWWAFAKDPPSLFGKVWWKLYGLNSNDTRECGNVTPVLGVILAELEAKCASVIDDYENCCG